MAIPVASDVLEALDWWERNVAQRLGGAVLRGVQTGPINLPRIVAKGVLGPFAPSREALAEADASGVSDPSDWVDIAYRDNPIGKFVFTTAADPLNLAGFGLPRKLATKAPALLKPGLQALDAAERLPGRLMGGVLDVGSRLVESGAGRLTQALAPVGDELALRYPSLSNLLKTGVALWREQALASPFYVAQTAIDNLARPALRGDWRVVADQLGQIVGRQSAADRIMSERGVQLPFEVLRPRMDSTLRSLDLGGLSPLRGPLAKALEFFPGLAVNLDNAARKSAFAYGRGGLVERLARDAAALGDEIRQKASGPAVDRLVDELLKSGGRLSRQDLHTMLGNAGITGQTRYDLVRRWRELGDESVKSATGATDELFFTRETPLDDLASAVFAFPRFAIRSLPWQARVLSQRPGLLNALNNYYRVGEEAHPGLSNQRYGGQYPLLEFANGERLSVDPLSMTSFGQFIRNVRARERDDGASTVGEVAETLRDLGFGLLPPLDMLLYTSGQYGRSLPPGVLRWSQPLNAGLGMALGRPVDIEAPLKWLEDRAFEASTGRPAFDYLDYLVRKRLAERVWAETGWTVEHPLYRESLARGGPLLDAARNDVATVRGLESLLRYLGAPVRLATEEERMAGENFAQARAHRAAGMPMHARMNPSARIYSEADAGRDRAVEIARALQTAQGNPEQLRALLDLLSSELYGTGPRVPSYHPRFSSGY